MAEQIKEAADIIKEHYFNLLGSGVMFLGAEINWHRDLKTGFVWPLAVYPQVRIIDLTNEADVKVPWELSRFQHLAVLGQAYWLTGKRKYVAAFVRQIEDWLLSNPVGYGVNWTCAMEVAIRTVNWIIAYYYFAESPVVSKDFFQKFFQHLYQSGRFIANNLEVNALGHGNNHYLANLAGLIWLGIFFKDFSRESRQWLRIGLSGFIGEMEQQVYAEGTSFEASLAYHRLATEIFLSTTILAEKNGLQFPKWYRERLEKMCEFILFYTKPGGLAPQIGDDDNGRFHIFSGYGGRDQRDHRHLLAVAGQYFGRGDFTRAAGGEIGDAVWLCGGGEFRKEAVNSGASSLLVKAYPQMGYYLIRDDRVFFFIRGGTLGQHGQGGHSHNDQLSFELQIDGQDLFIDPGTYTYTASARERNLFRSTAMHNTLGIMATEQNDFLAADLFTVAELTHTQVQQFVFQGEKIIFQGRHAGFLKKHGAWCYRKITYDLREKKILIFDWLEPHLVATANLILAPHLAICQLSEHTLQLSEHILLRTNYPIVLNQVWQSSSYGVKRQTNRLQIQGITPLIMEIEFGGTCSATNYSIPD